MAAHWVILCFVSYSKCFLVSKKFLEHEYTKVFKFEPDL